MVQLRIVVVDVSIEEKVFAEKYIPRIIQKKGT